MPNHIVSGNVDTMMRAADNAAIRSAIGVGTTDVPVVAGIAGGTGGGFAPVLQTTTTSVFHSSISGFTAQRHFTFGYQGAGTGGQGASTTSTGAYAWTSSGTDSDTTRTLLLFQDAAGILAQRNGVNAQALRVANSVGALPLTDYDRGVFDFKTTTNTLRIGTENGGTYTTARPIDFVTGGTKRAGFTSGGNFDVIYNLSTAATFYFGASFNALTSPSAGVVKLSNLGETDFGRLQLGGTTSAFPAIKRNGTGIDIRLADDSAFAPVKGKLTTDTNYTVGVPSATGYLTIYDATGTAYRVPCTV